MTDTTRPEWMPDLLDVQEQSDLHLGWADDEAMDFIYHTGLRAQIAVLEEMRLRCDVLIGGVIGLPDYVLDNKLAALRKELGE